MNSAGCRRGGEAPGPTITICPDGVRFRASANLEVDGLPERHVGHDERVAHPMLRPENDPPPAK